VGDDQDATWIIIMVIGALLCGLVVLYLKPDYRFEEIIESNKNYYPAIEPEPPGQSGSSESPTRGGQ
jgi:hypothetical protein